VGLLLALHTFGTAPEFEDDRCAATAHVMAHLAQHGLRALQRRHLQQLADMHAGIGNHTECALALVQVAALWSWDTDAAEKVRPGSLALIGGADGRGGRSGCWRRRCRRWTGAGSGSARWRCCTS
jgi:hypothetical protein